MKAHTAARIAPLHENDPRSQDPVLEELVGFVGYRPNALLTMARKPGLVPAVLSAVALIAVCIALIVVPILFGIALRSELRGPRK